MVGIKLPGVDHERMTTFQFAQPEFSDRFGALFFYGLQLIHEVQIYKKNLENHIKRSYKNQYYGKLFLTDFMVQH
jgi:hypothetical protein